MGQIFLPFHLAFLTMKTVSIGCCGHLADGCDCSLCDKLANSSAVEFAVSDVLHYIFSLVSLLHPQ